MPLDRSEENDERTDINRRALMKALGGATVGLAGMAGTASAGGEERERKKKRKKKGYPKGLAYNFYGCSQVCVNRRKVTAVVWTGKKFRYARITRSSNRNDPPVRDWKNVYCYAVENGAAIVGIYYKGTFYENGNRCARNYPKPKKCKSAYE